MGKEKKNNEENLKEKIEKLEKEIKELKEDKLRCLAEFENFRRRKESESLEMRDYAILEFVQELLPALDNFELSLKMSDNKEQFIKGVEMIHKNIHDILNKYGFEYFEPKKNEDFNPEFHDPLIVETEDGEDGKVLSVIKKGYKYKGKVIRPSKVKVKKVNQNKTKKILMVVAPEDFRDEEYFEPKKVFEKKGFEVKTMSKGVKEAKGKLGGKTNIDIDLNKINKDEIVKNFDAIVLSGGTGAIIYQKEKILHDLIKTFYDKDKVIGAICIAPTILAYSGILKGKKATVWNDEGYNIDKILTENGAIYVKEDVVVDGNIITANGPKAAKKFGEKVVEVINQN